MALKNIPPQLHPDLEEFTEICKQNLGKDLVSIIVFGSIARGTTHRWSDFDFYVITKRRREQDRLKIMKQFTPNCDLIFRRERDVPAYLKNLSALDLDIFNDGILIYGKDILKKNRNIFERIKQQYHLIRHQHFGKGVWEIGTAG